MVSNNGLALNPEIATLSMRGLSKMNTTPKYERARLRTPSGETHELVCVDFQDELTESTLLVDDSFKPELRADLVRALTKLFTPVERRIILRVLVQGLSVEEATKRTAKSTRSWQRWVSDTALPALRVELVEWNEELARLGTDHTSKSGSAETAPVETSSQIVKCKHCTGFIATGKRGFSLLRAHVSDAHPDIFKAVQQSLSEQDTKIQQAVIDTLEPQTLKGESIDDSL